MFGNILMYDLIPLALTPSSASVKSLLSKWTGVVSSWSKKCLNKHKRMH